MAAPAIIYKPPTTGLVRDEIELVIPRPTREITAQKYVTPQGTKVPRRSTNILVTAPAAGADWSLVTPANTIRLIQTIFARLVTSAVVANRFPTLEMASTIAATGTRFLRSEPRSAQIAGQALQYNALPGIPAIDGPDNTKYWALGISPTLVPGDVVRTQTDGLDVGDQWSQIALKVTDYAIPKGLAIDEVPMGLESGFQWDLEDVRKVA